MRVCLFVHPGWSPPRAYAFTQRLAEKYPDVDVLSVGMGAPTYQAERGALAAGLRVAAFRVEGRPPVRGQEPEYGPRLMDVVVHELLPGNADHAERLWTADGRKVGAARGYTAAWELSAQLAARSSTEVIALTPDSSWPGVVAALVVPA